MKQCLTLIALAGLLFLNGCDGTAASNRKEPYSEQRINTYAQQLTAMVARAKTYTGTGTMAFVIFNTDDTYAQCAADTPGRIIIDLPVDIMSQEKADLLRKHFTNVHENYAFESGKGPIDLISYQVYFQSPNMQENINRAAVSIDKIFLKVLGQKNGFSLTEIRTEIQ